MADSIRELVTVLRYELQDGELKKYVEGFRDAQKEIKQAADIVRGKLQPAVQQVERAAAPLRERVKEAQQATSGLRERMQQTAATARTVGKNLADSIRQGTGDARAAMDKLEARASMLRGKLAWSMAATTAAAYALARPVENAAKFERENQLIGNTANMTPQQIEALRGTILTEAKATNQKADDLQAAIGYLVAAGMDVKTAQASIRTIGRATTAAGADIQDMAQAAFTLQDALKIDPSGLQQAIDILATAGKEGNVELKDMARVLPVLGAQFQSLKMQGPEAAATMAASLEIARKGAATADEAANNLQNFLAKILSPTTLANAQKKFGLDLYGTVRGAQRSGANPFEAAMQAIMKATGGDQKKLGELFQDMQVQNFLRPMMQNWGEYQRIKGVSLNQSAGTTDRDFAKMVGTASEQMKAFSIAADNLSKSLGRALTPAITRAMNALAPLIQGFAVWIDKHRQLAAAGALTVAGLVALRMAIIALQIATVSAEKLKVLSGSIGGIPGAADGATKGLGLFLGKLGLVAGLSEAAIAIAGKLGLPTPEQIENQGDSVGADAVAKGQWWRASANLDMGTFLGAFVDHFFKGRSNADVAAILNGDPLSASVSPSRVQNTGLPQWTMVPTTITNSPQVTVNAQGVTNAAAVGSAAAAGTVKGMREAQGWVKPWVAPHTGVEKSP